MQLRKVCNHPYLIQGVFERVTQGLKSDEAIRRMLIASSGKLVLIDKLLPRLKEGGHRILLFSQMKMVLNLVQRYLEV